MPATIRQARCTCGALRPSSPDLAFFEDRSAGTQDHVCRHCRYFDVAHKRDERRVNPEVPSQCRHPFEPMTEGYEFDSFYCGHGGWD